ncbi:MAG TPA: pyridoxal-phosphate dependent enzyme, partial [Polyangiaceae bacterium]|nr:pyridoxal-phosphate dependent enzyme [Polyangiaceae bacterium]
IAVRVPIAEAVADMHDVVDDVLLVDDGDLRVAMRLLEEHAGIIAEPSGAAGLAAIVARRAAFANQRVATVVTGGNVTVTKSEK